MPGQRVQGTVPEGPKRPEPWAAGPGTSWLPGCLEPRIRQGPGTACASCLAPYLALTMFPALSSTISSNPMANTSAGLPSSGVQGGKIRESELPDLQPLVHRVLSPLPDHALSLLGPTPLREAKSLEPALTRSCVCCPRHLCPSL